MYEHLQTITYKKQIRCIVIADGEMRIMPVILENNSNGVVLHDSNLNYSNKIRRIKGSIFHQ